MSTTPNFGFNTEVPAITGIDRELKRVEDKADASLLNKVDKQEGHGLISDDKREQIVINRENIACLASKLDSYASKCDLELHILNSNAHQGLFDRKVDKLEGHGLISDEDLAQIAINKGNIEVNQQNITVIRNIIADMYSKGEINSLLSNKMNKEPPREYDVPYTVQYTDAGTKAKYFKSQEGVVTLAVDCKSKDEGDIARGATIVHMPVGFRPMRTIMCTCLARVINGNTSDYGHAYLHAGGGIQVYFTTAVQRVYFNVGFLAAQ